MAFFITKVSIPTLYKVGPLMNFKDGTHDRRHIHLFRTPDNMISLDATLTQALPFGRWCLVA